MPNEGFNHNTMEYVLAPHTKYRREWFGGLVYCGSTRATRFFNHSAAFALEQFGQPVTFATVQGELDRIAGAGDDSIFLESLMRERIISEASSVGQIGKTFFTDEADFVPERLQSPLGVELELTLKCARRCTYCAYDSSPEANTFGQLTYEEYGVILRELASAGVFYVRFTGGDPLTRIDAIDIARQADECGFGLMLASDLSVLTRRHVEELAALKNLIAIQTTLDGSTPEIADRLRGAGNFRAVTRGMQLLREHGVPLIVGTVLTKHNMHDIYSIAKLIAQWDATYCVSPLYQAGRARGDFGLVPTDDDLSFAYDQFARAVNEGLVSAADPAWNVLAQHAPPDVRRTLWQGQPWLVRSPDRLLRVDPFGRCYTSIHLKEVAGDDVYVGKLPGPDLLELWRTAPFLNNLRAVRKHNAYYGEMIDIRTLNSSKEDPHGEFQQ